MPHLPGALFVRRAGVRPSAKKEIHNVLKEPELAGACLLVFANKQDLPRVRAAGCSRDVAGRTT